MTIAATCWATYTDVAERASERLLLMVMADCTDHQGVCLVDSDWLGRVCRLSPATVDEVLGGLIARGVISRISVPESVQADLAGDSPYLLRAWSEREALENGRHPVLGAVDLR